jgi:drug/metabolite transporter (DMT)-like permease
MAQISQVQLVRPVMTITWAGLLRGEHITAATLLGGLVVIARAGTAVRARVH